MSTMHEGLQGGEEDRALQELRTHLTGSVIEPQDPLYDEARAVWNGMIDVRPRAVIRAAAVGDIDPVLHTARRTGLPLAVRGGGHNIAGHGTVEGGLVLDLSQLRGVEVDVKHRLVTVEPGATLADVDRATAAHGLAVPLGVISATGVAGLTLGGGVGWLTRSNGLSLDNLDLRRRHHGHRRAPARQRTGEPRAVLGVARRGRELRGGLVLHLPRPAAAGCRTGWKLLLPPDRAGRAR